MLARARSRRAMTSRMRSQRRDADRPQTHRVAVDVSRLWEPDAGPEPRDRSLRTGLALRTTSFVGRVRLGEIEVTVSPKLPSDALVPLLRYAYGLRDLHLLPTTSGMTQDLGLQDLLAWQLVEEAKRLLARGL